MADGESAFNVPDALGRLMNNKNLYKKLLDKFGAGYGEYEGKVLAAFGEGNFEEAVHLSHTMKGLAGNLGAVSLQEASLALETIAKGGVKTPDLDGALEKFSHELRRALKEVADGVNLG
ncbi:MAG: Hpt domain-containing protein [Synergistaceae bacterium]|jgi:HPt (histidine-containing phosphotransfer) domain-containing protein|nr:Hpt domain-containing protein [Synergistaceae bacterium]